MPPVDYWVTNKDGIAWAPIYDPMNYGLPLTIGWMDADLLFIPNRSNPNAYKDLYLELDYKASVPASFTRPEVFSDPRSVVNLLDSVQMTASVTLHWTITLQPCYELIGLWPGWKDGLIKVDVATICVPESSTYFAGIFALGMLGLRGMKLKGYNHIRRVLLQNILRDKRDSECAWR